MHRIESTGKSHSIVEAWLSAVSLNDMTCREEQAIRKEKYQSVKKKVAPTPGSASAQMRPPWR